jgi:hypothetical protein
MMKGQLVRVGPLAFHEQEIRTRVAGFGQGCPYVAEARDEVQDVQVS